RHLLVRQRQEVQEVPPEDRRAEAGRGLVLRPHHRPQPHGRRRDAGLGQEKAGAAPRGAPRPGRARLRAAGPPGTAGVPAGKVVIVTGGAAGIGKATARRFAAAGARVAVWDVKEGDGGAGVFQKVDVTDPAAVEAAVAEVFERWGRIDVLVNNAGIVKDAQLVTW